MIPMRPSTLAAVVLAAALLAHPVPAGRALGDDAPKLRDTVLDNSLRDESRLKAAKELAKKDPEMLGGALMALGEKKNAINLPFLVSIVVQEPARHFRLAATWAAWQSSPDGAAAAFLEKAALEDDFQAIRAIEAVGMIAPVAKDRTVYPKLLEITKGPRVYPGIEAARAVNRAMDSKLQRDLVLAACNAEDNHVRKHLVWAVLDLAGDERAATRIFEAMFARPGKEGKNANECVEVLKDKNAKAHAWKPLALKDVPAWWKSGRPKGVKTVVDFADDATNAKVETWFAELKKMTPVWDHLVNSSIPRISFRRSKDPEIFDLKKMTIELDASEVARAETPWQGTYVLVRDSFIALTTQFGEPCTAHRGWEPAYVDVYAYMKATDRASQKFADFVEESIAKKPWP